MRNVIKNEIKKTYKTKGIERIAPRIIKMDPIIVIVPSKDIAHEIIMIDLFDIDVLSGFVSRETFYCLVESPR
mgnify:CR=1 FL=1